jgi:hypothetical protein
MKMKMKMMKVISNLQNMMKEELQPRVGSELTEVMKVKIYGIQFVPIMNLLSHHRVLNITPDSLHFPEFGSAISAIFLH